MFVSDETFWFNDCFGKEIGGGTELRANPRAVVASKANVSLTSIQAHLIHWFKSFCQHESVSYEHLKTRAKFGIRSSDYGLVFRAVFGVTFLTTYVLIKFIDELDWFSIL